jgi:hypothetical protein
VSEYWNKRIRDREELTTGELKNNIGKSTLLPLASSKSTFSRRLAEASQGYPRLLALGEAQGCKASTTIDTSVCKLATSESILPTFDSIVAALAAV